MVDQERSGGVVTQPVDTATDRENHLQTVDAAFLFEKMDLQRR